MRNVPPDPDESVSEHVEHFFYVNHPDHYLLHKVYFNNFSLAIKDAEICSKTSSIYIEIAWVIRLYHTHLKVLD